jgi:hypothetical protein
MKNVPEDACAKETGHERFVDVKRVDRDVAHRRTFFFLLEGFWWNKLEGQLEVKEGFFRAKHVEIRLAGLLVVDRHVVQNKHAIG